MKTVLVTGVSSGIGYAIAEALIEAGIKVFGSVRNQDDAKRLQSHLGATFTPLIFDITNEVAVKAGAESVKDHLQGKTLFGLINNAGVVVPGPLLYLPIAKFRQQIEVNLTGQLIVTQAFAPLLGASSDIKGTPGKIINISSVSGKRVFPFFGAYAASKHALEALSHALRLELSIFGIDVITVGPGAVESNIWGKGLAETQSQLATAQVYTPAIKEIQSHMEKFSPKNILPATVIAALVLKILKSKHPKLRYSPVPRKWLNWTLPQLLPQRLTDWIILKYLGLTNKRQR